LNFKNITEGWKHYFSGATTAEEKRRAAICEVCPAAMIGSYEKLMPDYSLKEIKGLKCGECGCPLSTKIRSKNEQCDLKKW